MGRLYAWVIVRLRLLVVAGWIAFAVWATHALPSIQDASTGVLGALVPHNAEAIKAEAASLRLFGFPLLTRTVDVQRNPDGLPPGAQVRAIRRVVALDRHQDPGLKEIVGAYPVTNFGGLLPFSRERGTTILTFLFFAPTAGTGTRLHAAQRFANRHIVPDHDAFVGATWTFPARAEYQDAISSNLDLVTLATVLLVLALVGWRFRALGAPLLTVAAVGISYLVAIRVVAYLASRVGITVPNEVQPVIIVLLFGVVTDYAVFFLARVRERREEGELRVEAAKRATRELLPILVTAGLTVVLASGALVVSPLDFFQAFGPGLAIAVLVGLLVSISFVPAVLAILGNALYWPREPAFHAPEGQIGEPPETREPLAIRIAARRPVPVVVICLALLGLAISGLGRMALGGTLIRGLPHDSKPYQAYRAATKGFAPGVLAPTVLVLHGGGVKARRGALARLQEELAHEPGVAGVLGPSNNPLPRSFGAALSRKADAARYLVAFGVAPYGAQAIGDLERLRRRLHALERAAGIPPGTRTLVAGDTALQSETVDATTNSLWRIIPAALGVIFLILVVFLRSLVAPLYLIVAAALGPAAGIGVSAYFFQDLLGYGQVTYYVPVATMVLLIALGSDYNVYLVGRVWEEARRRRMYDAVLVGGGGATKAISTAGLALAGSFALLALIPLLAFEQVAFTMAIGLLIDAFLVRAFLIPAVIVLLGRRSAWPGSSLRREPHERRPSRQRERVATSVTGRGPG